MYDRSPCPLRRGRTSMKLSIARVLAVCLLGWVAGCGGSDSPTNPTGPSAPSAQTETRIMALEGDLNFGDVAVGASAEKVIRIVNRGTATLTVYGLTGPSGFNASWTSGAIPSNQWQDTTVRF